MWRRMLEKLRAMLPRNFRERKEEQRFLDDRTDHLDDLVARLEAEADLLMQKPFQRRHDERPSR